MEPSFISVLMTCLEGWAGVFIVTLVIIILINFLHIFTTGMGKKK